MLLRTTAIALLAANALYFGWSLGLLAPLGLAPETQSEPQRLAQQIHPEALRVAQTAPDASAPTPATAPAPVVPASEPASAPVAAAAPACLRAGPFDAAQAESLRHALAAASLPEGTWVLEGATAPARWIVYMGRYNDLDLLDKKRAELRALRVETAPVARAALAPGLSLGVFSSVAAAQEHLAQLARRGVRSARVVPEPPENTAVHLRLPAADEALRARVQPLASQPLTPC